MESYRAVAVMLNRLPAESWTQTTIRDTLPPVAVTDSSDRSFGPWALGNYQIAALIDAVRTLSYIAAVVGQVAPPPTPPKPEPRPGLANVRPINPAAASYLRNLRASRGA